MNNNNTSFWQFLKNHQKIEIPIIQRDYAQGRIGKEHLRKRFLEQLKSALDSERITLDFVYGNIEDKTDAFCPIDGQQRLTTLWLLHWYIAFRREELQKKEVRDTLQKFTYETRISSREFCFQLCNLTDEDYKPEGSIIDYIYNQTWFFTQWKQDPTIQAMLIMLGGTGQEDGIIDLWGRCTDQEMQKYWEKLTSTECPITFFQNVISSKEMTGSDDLYIKMNARGKQLSHFENFKADLIAWKREKGDFLPELESNLDNKWIDVFWNTLKDKSKIDDTYFAFFNRYLLNTFISKQTGTKTNIQESDIFQHLYGNKGDDNEIKYTGFDIYEQIITPDTIAYIGKILENYSKVKKEITSYFPQWAKQEEFSFIPTDEDNNISTLTQAQRVVFYAICRFLEKVSDKFDEESFRKWMRVIWNIVENAYMDIDSMISHIQLVNDLSERCYDIYNYLQNLDVSKLTTKVSQEQLNEEIAKSKRLLNYPNETEQIQKAENYAFFKGVIRFLFIDAKGDMNDWADFDTKWQNVQKYFDTEGVSEKYKKEAKLFRRLLSYYIDQAPFYNITYDFTINSWKKILTHASNKSPVHCLLMKDDVLSYDYSLFKSSIEEPKLKFTQEYLVHTSALEQIIAIEGCTIHWRGDWGRGCYALYPSNVRADWKKYFIHQRNNILCDRLFSFNDQWLEKCRNSTLFFGIHINFIYNNHHFQWWGTPNEKEVDIYLMNEDYKDYLRLNKELKENAPDEENYYCFKVNENESVDSFCQKLDELINNYTHSKKLL